MIPIPPPPAFFFSFPLLCPFDLDTHTSASLCFTVNPFFCVSLALLTPVLGGGTITASGNYRCCHCNYSWFQAWQPVLRYASGSGVSLLKIWKIQTQIWQDLSTTSHRRIGLDGLVLCFYARSPSSFLTPAWPVHVSRAMYSILSPFVLFFCADGVHVTAAPGRGASR